jgi:integrase
MWQKGMRRAVAAAGIEPATVRDLRRSFGTLLINAGARAESIQRLLGHSDQRMTLRTYARLLDEAQRADMEKLPTILEPTPVKELHEIIEAQANEPRSSRYETMVLPE